MTHPLFVFAPGAGAPSTSPWMERYAERLAQLGSVHRFDYDYMAAGKRAPDRLPKLMAAHNAAIAAARSEPPAGAGGSRKLILIGKSMGGRIGCHVSFTHPVSGLVCLGYPLVGMGKAKPLRDAVLKQLQTPVLFVQGTRDSLCPLDQLTAVRKQMNAKSELHVVESGDHSLHATKTWLKQNAQTQDDVDAAVIDRVKDFCRAL